MPPEPSGPRRWAQTLLRWSLRLAPEEMRPWAAAILHELAAVEGEWEALWWALGGITVVLRRAAWQWTMHRVENIQKWRQQMGKKAGWLLAGAVGAVALSLAAFGLLYLTAVSFPQLGLEHLEWMHMLVVVALPVAVCLALTIWLWQRRRPLAIGILVATLAMSTHVAIHFAHQFRAH